MNDPKFSPYTVADARAHAVAYFTAKGTVEFINQVVWTSQAAQQAHRALMASLKSMDTALERLQALKASTCPLVWDAWVQECPPIGFAMTEAEAATVAIGIRQAAHKLGFPMAFAEAFITDLANHKEAPCAA